MIMYTIEADAKIQYWISHQMPLLKPVVLSVCTARWEERIKSLCIKEARKQASS